MKTLTPAGLIEAYANGYFPMAGSREDPQLRWYNPHMRGVLPLDAFHTPRSLKKFLRRAPFEIRVDTAFEAVIRACAEPRPGHEDTWINATIAELYCALHAMGHAHSVECWQDGALAGGLYGVSLGAAFFGESMFSRVPNASKSALVHLVGMLREKRFELLDAQFLNAHLKQFGVVEIPREIYLRQLQAAISCPNRWCA